MKATGAKQILQQLNLKGLIQTHKVLKVNPTVEQKIENVKDPLIDIYQYNGNGSNVFYNTSFAAVNIQQKNTWINIDNINKDIVAELSSIFEIDSLIKEDILNFSQRPKVDELDHMIFCVMQMMYLDNENNSIDSEQISFLVREGNLVTIQEDETRDYFARIRERIRNKEMKICNSEIDYLFYCLLDCIVDGYYEVMDRLATNIEQLEEQVSKGRTQMQSMSQINNLRKELIIYKRNVVPVRDLLNSLIRSNNQILKPQSLKYFKDLQDHVIQAIELSENYHDVINNIRDMHYNQLNLRTNEAMKFMAIFTSLMAPATVIGGIFGMNFDRIPYLHNHYGFFMAVSLMVITSVVLIVWFKRKGWF